MTAFLQQTSNELDTRGRTDHAQRLPADRERVASRQRSSDTVTLIDAIQKNRRTALLTRVVEAEILPRLALARMKVTSTSDVTPPVSTQDDTNELVRLLLGREADGAAAFIEVLRLRGVTTTSLFLGVLTDTARRLGELWDDDRCDFTQVTISVGRLQQLVRSLSPDFQVTAVSHPHPDTVLLLPAPGEQHTFGLVILSEFFQREGWHVAGGPASGSQDAADLVRNTWVDIAGFSIGSTSRLEGLTGIIRTLRQVSRNRYISIMIGGPLLLQQPDLVTRVGADVGAQDAQNAVRQANGLLALRTAVE